MTPGKLKRHRRSSLEAFDACPFKFDVLYNVCQHCGHRHADTPNECPGDGGNGCMCHQFAHVEDRGDESQRGIGFHEIAFRYIDRLAKAKVPADSDEASMAFREGMALAQVSARLSSQVAKLWRPFAESFELDLDAYFTAEQQQVAAFCLNCRWRGDEDLLTWTGTGSPTDPRMPVCPDCGGPVASSTWIPDLVYVRPGEVEIKDWKTYYKGLTEEQARQEFQLKMYLWLALNLWPGFSQYRFTFNFVRLRYEVSLTFTPEEIEAWGDEIKGIMLKIYESKRTKNYPAIPGSHCNLCRLNCPVVDNPYRLPVRITRVEERNSIASRVLVLEREMRQLKKVLRANVETEGGFVHAGEIFALWPEVERRFPAQHIMDFLNERGIDTSKITLSASALGDLAHEKKGVPALLMEMDKTKIEKQGWTFRHKKHGENIPAGMIDLLTEGTADNGDGEL